MLQNLENTTLYKMASFPFLVSIRSADDFSPVLHFFR